MELGGREREKLAGGRGLNEKISRRRHGEKLDFLSSCDEYFTFRFTRYKYIIERSAYCVKNGWRGAYWIFCGSPYPLSSLSILEG